MKCSESDWEMHHGLQENDWEGARRRSAAQVLREFGNTARLVVYIAAAPGAGKTRRLLEDARRLRDAGKNVVLGWIETKGRPDLERLAQGLERIPPRNVTIADRTFSEFDFEAALAAKPDVLVLDELAHENLPGSSHEKRWQDAQALRDAGISVLTALNVAHLDTAAAVAEKALGYPVREIVPIAFLREADEVIALDVSPQLLHYRLKSGKIVGEGDVDRALEGAFKDSTLYVLRELLLRTIDGLTTPAVSAERTSTAAVFVPAELRNPEAFLKRTAAVASALDLQLEILTNMEHVDDLRASLVALPAGALAKRFVNQPVERDIFVVASEQTYLTQPPLSSHPLGATVGDRMRIGYGKLTVYLGAAAGSGKTMAMLDRGHQLQNEGIDVVAGFVETHGRKETAAMLDGLNILPRKKITKNSVVYEEFDREALIARHPKVALIDELAHTNAPGSISEKRFQDVLAVLRGGIDVITTLNIQHLEALGDAVFRLTGTAVRETLPDGILALADEVVLIDVTPELLRERLRQGKIYPPERIESALFNFFKLENLRALRELAVREALRAETREIAVAPFDRLLLSVSAKPDDLGLILRCSKIAARLHVDFVVVHLTLPKRPRDKTIYTANVARLASETQLRGGTWIHENALDLPKTLLHISRSVPETTIAVGGTLRNPRWLQPNSVARRLLDAGARELFVLARRTETTNESI